MTLLVYEIGQALEKRNALRGANSVGIKIGDDATGQRGVVGRGAGRREARYRLELSENNGGVSGKNVQ